MSGLPVRRTLVLCESYRRAADAVARPAIYVMPGVNDGVIPGARWRHADAIRATKLVSFRRHSDAQAGAMLTRLKTPRWCHSDATQDTKPV